MLGAMVVLCRNKWMKLGPMVGGQAEEAAVALVYVVCEPPDAGPAGVQSNALVVT